MRWWPRSLLGQVLLAVALALLVAQSISGALLWRAAEGRRDQAVLNAAAFRLVVPQQGSNGRQFRGRGEGRLAQEGPTFGRMPRPLRLESSATFVTLANEEREPKLEDSLRDILAGQGVIAHDLRIVEREVVADPYVRDHPRLLRRLLESEGPKARLLVAGLKREGSLDWQVARVVIPQTGGGALRTIIFQTIIIYLVLVGLHFLLLRRITRPLAALTRRTEGFGHEGNSALPLVAEGPQDVRRLIMAHNAMEARISALLDEKDVMLGAIGHDLKTPLAALRVRIESVEDETERGKMAASIKDITRSLDDILTLARLGKSAEPPERAELSTLVGSVVEEFEDRGLPVTLENTERIIQPVYVTWLKRALRNLISNAVRYAGSAAVSLSQTGGQIILRIDDDGPGIPEDRIPDMLEPFTRGEASRNRETGGAGLGLTIARAIAEQHRGTLVLTNRAKGGLRAEIRLPMTEAGIH